MTDKISFILAHPTARTLAARFALDEAPDGWVVTFRPPSRTLEQNAKLHAALGDISRQLKWHGETLDIEDWKRLLTAAWSRAEQQPMRIVPAVDGHGFDVLYHRTSRMTKSELSSLIEYLLAWGSEQGVKWTEPFMEAA